MSGDKTPSNQRECMPLPKIIQEKSIIRTFLKDGLITISIIGFLATLIIFNSAYRPDNEKYLQLYQQVDGIIKWIVIPMIFLDAAFSLFKKDNHHLKHDSFSNLIVGSVRSVIEPAAIFLMYVPIYTYAQSLSGLVVDLTHPLNWCIGLLLLDLAYYWDHRISHKIKFFWANHSIHHSGKRLNFMAAARGSWIEWIYRWVFRAPIALLGFSPYSIVLLFRLLRLYQIFHHTDRVLGNWPRIQKIFVTPEFHRLHHAVESKFHDANYGGFLTIWDHIYGTAVSRKPDESITYGVTYPKVDTRNPLSVVFSPLLYLFKNSSRKIKSELSHASNETI